LDTPLTLAIRSGHTSVLDALIDSKCDLHTRDEEGSSPLHLAACKERLEYIEVLVQKRFDEPPGPVVPGRQQNRTNLLLQRTGPPRPKALREFINNFESKNFRHRDADAEPETQAALENFDLHTYVGPDSLQASRSLDSFVVCLMRRPQPVARETAGKTKTDATSVGYVGLRVGLVVGEGGGVDWKLVVLEVDQVIFTSLTKLKRNDRIVRVGDKTELSDMIAHLKILDSTGGEQVEQIEIEATVGPDLDDVEVAEAAVPVSFPEEGRHIWSALAWPPESNTCGAVFITKGSSLVKGSVASVSGAVGAKCAASRQVPRASSGFSNRVHRNRS